MIAAGALAVVALVAGDAPAYDRNAIPDELKGISIDEKPGSVLPKDLEFTNQDGQKVKLSHYFDSERPTILVMAYYQCPMLCTLVLNALTDGIKDVAWNVGKEYRVLTVSIDGRDTVELASGKRANHVKSYGRAIPGDGWDFLIGSPENVKTLADAVGFHYRWDEQTQQFAHAAGAFVITPGGILSRTLYGISFREKDLRLALVEASEGKMGSAWERVLLFCFHYDPNARGYVLMASRLMQLGGVVTMLLVGAFLALMWRKESHASLPPPAERLT